MKVFLTGASSGIGEALARIYAARGATLGFVARRGDLLEQPAGLRSPRRSRLYACDVRDAARDARAAAPRSRRATARPIS